MDAPPWEEEGLGSGRCWPARGVPLLRPFWRCVEASRNRFAYSGLTFMQTFETTDTKVARRCRYYQHRDQKTSVMVRGRLVSGLVRSVMEVRSSHPTRWIIALIVKPSTAV